MNFNPDPTKQAQEVIFSQKLQNTNQPCLIFNHNTVSLTESHKYLGIVLDSRLDFKEHLKMIFKNVSKRIELLRKLQNPLPRKLLIAVCKLDHGDIIYDRAYKATFHRKSESI